MPSVCFFTSTSDNQYSQESELWEGHGVFTHFLLKGLRGDADTNKDRKISLGELIPFVTEGVRRETKDRQTPVLCGRFDAGMKIGY
jgi:uncharacterized caspase-like protein